MGDGYPDIRELAAIGDGSLLAVLDREATIRWLCLPRIDSPSVFGSLLDPDRGGHFFLRPSIPFEVKRSYLPHTNVLRTDFHTARGVVRVLDSMNVGMHGLLSWREVGRRIEGLSGNVPMHWEVLPRFDYGRVPADFRLQNGYPVVHDEHCSLAVMHWDVGRPKIAPDRVCGEFVARAGQKGLIALVTGGVEPLELSPRSHIETRIEHTIQYWKQWVAGIDYQGEWEDAVVRSALTLAMLVDPQTGAIIAAPTTSLPERIGGERNWDYRYCWTRDMSFTLDALMELGFRETANRSFIWLLTALRETKPELKPIYRIDQKVLREERNLDLRGYRDTRPVRVGNGAAKQVQLGTYGDLFATTSIYVGDGNVLDPITGRLLADVASYVAEAWKQKGSGIWELEEQRHYTIAKMGCWVALDRAIQLAEAGQLPPHRKNEWVRAREEVRGFIERHCWSEARKSYLQYADGDTLDAAVLLVGRTGYLKDRDPRLSSTIDAIRRELADGPLLYRVSGFDQIEAAFVACSFWLVDALTRARRLDEAAKLMDELVPLSNDLGLFSEQIDPRSGRFLGNFPQGLTHLTLINAASEFQKARERTERGE